jgi:hypothetical protein
LDRFGSVLPDREYTYSGETRFIREKILGTTFGFKENKVRSTVKTNFLSNDYRVDFQLVATNFSEFYSAAGRKEGMDGDYEYTIPPTAYAAPLYRIPRTTCAPATFKVRAWANNYYAEYFDPQAQILRPYYLDFPAGVWIQPYYFVPTAGASNPAPFSIAHNLLFHPTDAPSSPDHFSRALDSETTNSPLSSYRLANGIGLPNVTPLEALASNTVPLFEGGPYIWYGVIKNWTTTGSATAVFRMSWENYSFGEQPVPPLFATVKGDFPSDNISMQLNGPGGLMDLSQSNILWLKKIRLEDLSLGPYSLEAVSPPYFIAGVLGNSHLLAEFNLDNLIPDNSPPFIRSFELTSNGKFSDIMMAGHLNMARFQLGDITRWTMPEGVISTVSLDYQPLGGSSWTSLTLQDEGNNTWHALIEEADFSFSDITWIALRLVAVDNYNNSLTYTMTPAFMFNPWAFIFNPWEDSDGDGVENIHELYDANDTYTNKPTSDWQEPEPHGLPGKCPGACYFGDYNGDGVIDWDDLEAITDYLNGQTVDYSNSNPPSPNVQDLDGNTVLGVPDKNLYNLILNNRLVSLPGAPAYIDVVNPVGVPQVSVGDTVPIEVNVLDYLERGRAGLGVAFEVTSGEATLLGGDGPADDVCSPYARYDISAIIFQYGRARMVVRVDAPGPIQVDVYIPPDPVLKFPLIQVDAPVKITGIR